MTETNETVGRCLRVAAYLLEHHGNLMPGDDTTVQIINGGVTGYGGAFASALLAAGGTAGPWHGPRVRRQRNVTLTYQGVDIRGYQVIESAPAAEFDENDVGIEVEASND